MTQDVLGRHRFAPVQTTPNGFEQVWMTVPQAVVFCAERGITRTPKTLRKWAERSSGLPDGDIVARKEDTVNGYRWQIEKASLVRKIEEELELRGAHPSEPVPARSVDDVSGMSPEIPPKPTEPQIPQTEPVQTSADDTAPPEPFSAQQNLTESGAHRSEPVQTSLELDAVLDEVRNRLDEKNDEIAFLREQLKQAQTDQRSTLVSLDRVIRSFEMQSEANRAIAIGSSVGNKPNASDDRTVRFTPTNVDSSTHDHDIRRV